ncbi:unnamed protein product, partial [Brachionus calyciflorus]
MNQEYDKRMKVREPQIEVGVRVLVKTEQTKKADPRWDPRPYSVTAMKGTMVTVSREGHATPAPLEPRAGRVTETPQAKTQAIQVATPPQAPQAPAQTSAQATTTQPAQRIHDQSNKRKVGRPTKSEAKKIAQEKTKTNPVDSEVEPPR